MRRKPLKFLTVVQRTSVDHLELKQGAGLGMSREEALDEGG
jgi:hypothetical protein